MKEFNPYFEKFTNKDQVKIVTDIIDWIFEKYPILKGKIAWNQPMITINKSFVAGFSLATHHFSLAIESEALELFADQVKESGYERTKMFIKIKYTQEIDYQLLERIFNYKIEEKKDSTTFWKKK